MKLEELHTQADIIREVENLSETQINIIKNIDKCGDAEQVEFPAEDSLTVKIQLTNGLFGRELPNALNSAIGPNENNYHIVGVYEDEMGIKYAEFER